MRVAIGFLTALGALALAPAAFAQAPTNAAVVSPCGTPGVAYTAGQVQPLTMDSTGRLCDGATAAGQPGYKPTPLGYQQILAATLATATSLTVPTGANYCVVQPEGGAVRWLDYGTGSLTATYGYLLTDGQPYVFSGTTQLNAVQFIAATYGGSAQTPNLNVVCEK